MDYRVIDRPMGAPVADLEASLDALGADGWWVLQAYPIQYEQRRWILKKVPGTVEYLVTEAVTGRTAAEAETVLDSHGAEGWELINLYIVKQNQRRAIYARTIVTKTESFIYRFGTDNTPPPAAGYVLMDNDDASLATRVYVSNWTDNGTDIANYLKLLLVNDKIYIRDQASADNYYFFHLVAPPEPAADHVAYPVAFEKRGIANLTNNQTVALVMGTSGETNGGGGGGIPEAPMDDLTYGRRNTVWNQVIASNNDVLDGGNF